MIRRIDQEVDHSLWAGTGIPEQCGSDVRIWSDIGRLETLESCVIFLRANCAILLFLRRTPLS